MSIVFDGEDAKMRKRIADLQDELDRLESESNTLRHRVDDLERERHELWEQLRKRVNDAIYGGPR